MTIDIHNLVVVSMTSLLGNRVATTSLCRKFHDEEVAASSPQDTLMASNLSGIDDRWTCPSQLKSINSEKATRIHQEQLA